MGLLIAKCSRQKDKFAIRFQETAPGVWTSNWTFKIGEGSWLNEEAREQHKEKMDGRFEFAPDYPGCPHCGSKSFFQCNCGTHGCWDTVSRTITCPGCDVTAYLSGTCISVSGRQDG